MPIKDVEWFYNEIFVPKDCDVVGSYYMANGFQQGYFGMQVKIPLSFKIYLKFSKKKLNI